jgi:hypothetical protein
MRLCILSTLFLLGHVACTAFTDSTVSLFSQAGKGTNLDKYIDEMTFCYDLDGDGKLDRQEMKNMVRGQTGEKNCLAPFNKLQSKIIVDEKQLKTLQNLLGLKDKVMRLDLLYRASRDTCKAQVFHSKVDGVAGTVTLVTSPSGQIFGGYLSIATDKKRSGYMRDGKAMLFSVTKNETYPVIDPNRAFYNDPQLPEAYMNFGKDDLMILDGCRGQTYYFGEDYQLPNGMEYSALSFESTTYLHGEDTWEFSISEMETFQLITY